MNPAQLLAQFDRLADAQDAIPRLRRFILDLAVRGKLVDQVPTDEPAAESIQRIELQQKRLAAEGKLRRPTTSSDPIEELPFPVPSSWQWVRLIDLLTKLTDGTHHSPPNHAEGDFKYITAKNIKPEGVSVENVTYVDATTHNEIYGRCDPKVGDVLYIKDGATTGVVTINNLDEPFSMLSSVALMRLADGVFNRLFIQFLRSPFFYGQMRAFMKGAAITRLTLKRMAPALIPLPPLAEQHRIVAKVDELMALCDKLEAAQAERESRRDRLVRASLNRLNQPADDAANFRDHARFTLDNLPQLTTRPEHIPQLRQAILNLAVRGKLVPQDPDDEPSSELMRRIVVERLSASKKNDASSKSYSAEIGESEFLFEIPSSWRWVRAVDLCHCVVSGSTPPQEVFHPDTGAPFLKVYNIREQQVDFNYKKQFIDFAYHSSKSKRSILHPGDVLMNIVGPPLGKTAVVPNDYPEWNCNQAITAFRPVLPEMAAYLYTFFREGSFLRNIELIGTAGQDNISVTKCRNIAVPLPPLGEQHRIVAKVYELLALCDRLESQLTTTQTASRRLLETVLHEALASSA